jgi:hypothetical protein
VPLNSSTAFWHVAPYSLVETYLRFGKTWCLRLQGAEKSAFWLLGLFFDPQDGGIAFLRNVSKLSPDYTMLQPVVSAVRIQCVPTDCNSMPMTTTRSLLHAAYGNSRCLSWHIHETHNYSAGKLRGFWMLVQVVYTITAVIWRVG